MTRAFRKGDSQTVYDLATGDNPKTLDYIARHIFGVQIYTLDETAPGLLELCAKDMNLKEFGRFTVIHMFKKANDIKLRVFCSCGNRGEAKASDVLTGERYCCSKCEKSGVGQSSEWLRKAII